MRYDLPALAKAKGLRRSKPLREIVPTATMAGDLYRAAYAPVVNAWTAALPTILAAYERSVVEVRDGLVRDSISDIQAAIDEAGDSLTRLILTLLPGLRDWTVRAERWHRGKWRGAVLTATGIDLDTILTASGEPQSVAETIAWNTSLIRDVSDQARQRISNIVFSRFQQRAPIREIAAELREAVGMSRRRALLIASDQTQKLSAALDSERMKEAGIEAWKWRWSHKRHGRAEHIARDGKRFTFAEPPSDMPGELPWCGCRKQALLELD